MNKKGNVKRSGRDFLQSFPLDACETLNLYEVPCLPSVNTETFSVHSRACPFTRVNIGTFSRNLRHYDMTFLILGLILFLVKFLELKFTKLKLTDQRLVITRGVFSRSTKNLELYRT